MTATTEKPLTRDMRPDGLPLDLPAYEKAGGYQAIRKVLQGGITSQAVTALVKDANLRGRGGAGFSTGMKWSFVPVGKDVPSPTYLVVNADEMEPGTFKDRLLMERNPHQLIEGAILAGFAIEADVAYIFLRGEYTLAAESISRAIAEAYERSYLGKNILGSGYRLELHLHLSGGRYICGEETGLLNALEGKRANPRSKPPFPPVVGLFGKPTVVNNVETLCCVPHIVNNGAAWFRGLGRTSDAGTKLYGASGKVKRPGLWELPMGATVREILEEHAGGMRDGVKFRGLLPGGASTPFIVEEHLDTVRRGHGRRFRGLSSSGAVLMILVWLLVILFFGGILAGIAVRWNAQLSRWIALAAISVDLALTAGLWFDRSPNPSSRWLEEVNWNWVPAFGIHFHLAVDGLSLLMLLLTFFLGIVSVLASWTEIRERVGFFHFNLLWVLTGIAGVFLAVDLFLFYFAWELMLVPMYFLIVIWGHERRVYAAVKFFLFTQCSGLLMLIAILALYFIHHQVTGIYTFEYSELLGTHLSSGVEMVIMLGFFVAFAVKLPAVPLHTWLPDAHTEAPTAGSVILAGLLLKTGAYGMMRFVVPLFPHAAHEFTPVALVLAVTGIVYGAVMAYSQTDFRRLVAYTSVSHLGFVLLGIFSWNPLALQGAILTMICHGLSTGGLFVLVGGLQERIHTRDLERMGGIWTVAPRLSGAVLFFSMASLGLPGIGDFVGEFLVVLGSYRVSVPITVVASIGILASTFYALRMVQRAFQGSSPHPWRLSDLTPREGATVAAMIAGLLWLGLYPQPVLNTFQPAMQNLQHEISATTAAVRR